MVLIERSYKNKEGQEVQLKVPKIRLGNNLGEGESVEIEPLFPIYKDDKGLYKNYSVKANYNGEEVYAQLTQVGAHILEKYDYINHKFKFTRTIENGKTKMLVEPTDSSVRQKSQSTIQQTATQPQASTQEGIDLLNNTVMLEFTDAEQEVMNKLMTFKGQPAFEKGNILITLKKHVQNITDERADMIANHLLSK